MAPSGGGPINSQIIPERAPGCPFIFIMCEVAVVKLAFSSFSCHWKEKYELWADAPGWEPVAGLWPPGALPARASPTRTGPAPASAPSPSLAAGSRAQPRFLLVSLFPASASFTFTDPFLFPLSQLGARGNRGFLTVALSLAPNTRPGTGGLKICRTNESFSLPSI